MMQQRMSEIEKGGEVKKTEPAKESQSVTKKEDKSSLEASAPAQKQKAAVPEEMNWIKKSKEKNMANNYFQCSECGQTTREYNEGQCPHCMTLDSLYTSKDIGYIGEDWETFDTAGYSFVDWD